MECEQSIGMGDDCGQDGRQAPGATSDGANRVGGKQAAALDLMTVHEVATLLRVSKMTVYRLVHAGTLRATRVGQSLRLPRATVEAFLRDTDTRAS
jgi:excisionase family DNA binding protein